MKVKQEQARRLSAVMETVVAAVRELWVALVEQFRRITALLAPLAEQVRRAQESHRGWPFWVSPVWGRR